MTRQILADLCCRRMLPSATSLMKEQEVALEIFLPLGRCLLTLLSKRSKVLSPFDPGFHHNRGAAWLGPKIDFVDRLCSGPGCQVPCLDWT